jgi:hypothetical protein
MHTMSEQRGLSRATRLVVEAVATVRGVDPVDLDVPLFEAVDPDALDTLFESDVPDLQVTFRYHGHDIVLTRGAITVDDRSLVIDG